MNRPFTVLWTNTASKDFEYIFRYIAHDSPSHARSIFDRIKNAASGLATFPERGRIVPELASQGIRLYRELIVSPWRIVYRLSGKSVYFLAVLDERRNIEDILLQRLIDREM